MNRLELMLGCIPGVDYETAIKRMSDNTAIYAELLRLFFKNNPPQKLAEALKKHDYVGAAYEAHSIKGTSANLGLTDISRIAADIHLKLKQGDTAKAQARLDDLEQACHLVSSIVKRLDGGAADE